MFKRGPFGVYTSTTYDWFGISLWVLIPVVVCGILSSIIWYHTRGRTADVHAWAERNNEQLASHHCVYQNGHYEGSGYYLCEYKTTSGRSGHLRCKPVGGCIDVTGRPLRVPYP